MSCQYIKYVMIFFWKYSILHKKFKKTQHIASQHLGLLKNKIMKNFHTFDSRKYADLLLLGK